MLSGTGVSCGWALVSSSALAISSSWRARAPLKVLSSWTELPTWSQHRALRGGAFKPRTLGLLLRWLPPRRLLAAGLVGVVLPNSTALALSGRPEQAGSASTLFGALQYLLGTVAASLVVASGADTAVPMATLMCGFTLAGLAIFVLLNATGLPQKQRLADRRGWPQGSSGVP